MAARELIGRAHAAPEVDRVLELDLRRRRISAGAGDETAREAQRGAQLGGAGGGGELPQLLDARLGGAEVFDREVHTDRQLQARRPPQALARRQGAQVAGDQVTRAQRVAPVQRELGEAQLRGGMPRDPLAQLGGLVRAALAPAQLRQAQDALEDERRRAPLERPRRGLQLGFRVGPPAAADQHRRVVGAAEAEELRHLPALADALHRLAPLRGSLDVVDALARVDHVAAHGAGEMQPGQLPGHRGGRRLVEVAHAFADRSRRDPREAREREREHLQIHDAGAPADVQRAGRVGCRTRRIAVRDERDLAFEEREPALLDAVVRIAEQPVGVPEPALCDRVVAAEHDGVVGEPRGDASRRARIAAATIGAEGAGTGVEARVPLAQEARRLRPALQRLGLLAVRERRLGLAPRPSASAPRDLWRDCDARSQPVPARASDPG